MTEFYNPNLAVINYGATRAAGFFATGVGAAADSDAQAFIAAAAITDSTQKSAVNALVKGLKANNLWAKLKAVYPFVGGTASSHKFNLKDPRDLDAAFRLSFTGGWTHSATGALPDGSTAYADTYLNPASKLSLNSTHLSYYSRSNISGSIIAIGAKDTVWLHIDTSNSANDGNAIINSGSSNLASSSGVTDTRVFFLGSRIAPGENKLYINGSLNATGAAVSSAQPNLTIFLGARNTSGSATSYSAQECAFASIGDGLTDADAANLYTRVQAFETALSRNI